jgi:hypothetical protein
MKLQTVKIQNKSRLYNNRLEILLVLEPSGLYGNLKDDEPHLDSREQPRLPDNPVLGQYPEQARYNGPRLPHRQQ